MRSRYSNLIVSFAPELVVSMYICPSGLWASPCYQRDHILIARLSALLVDHASEVAVSRLRFDALLTEHIEIFAVVHGLSHRLFEQFCDRLVADLYKLVMRAGRLIARPSKGSCDSDVAFHPIESARQSRVTAHTRGKAA